MSRPPWSCHYRKLLSLVTRRNPLIRRERAVLRFRWAGPNAALTMSAFTRVFNRPFGLNSGSYGAP